MLRTPLQRLYERLGPRYPRVALVFAFVLEYFVVGGGVLLLNLYVDISLHTFWRIALVSAVLVSLEVGAALWLGYRLVRPADRWLVGQRTPDTALAAWSALAGLPVDLLRFGRGIPVALNTIPISIYLTLELHGTFWSFLAINAGALVVLAYGVFLRFFVTELAMRPVLADVSRALPDGADLGERSVPLRTKLLVALPVINVVTGVVVAGLASGDPSLRALGVGVVVALVVAFTLSFELSALLARSVVEPIEDLREGTERVTAGDLGVRVPVLGTDETGRLAESFNQMVAGLEERERLREAFGAFVAPQLAERVLEEGTVIEGEEIEVTVLFVDIREFTAFAEHASAPEVVAELSAFYELVVPVLVRHGATPTSSSATGCSASSGRPSISTTTPTAAWRPRSRSPRSCAARTTGGCASASASTPGRSWPAPSAAADASSSRS